VLLLSGLVVGAWGTIAPASFFGDFPGAGHRWVSPLGPYNEHLTRDVAGLNLALAALAAFALARPAPEVIRAAGVAWFVWSVPHLAYHVAELDRLGPFDAVAQTVTLVLILVLAAGLTVRPGSGTRAR
jgi:hypothetical protein